MDQISVNRAREEKKIEGISLVRGPSFLIHSTNAYWGLIISQQLF